MEIPLTAGDEYYAEQSYMKVTIQPEDQWKAYRNNELHCKVILRLALFECLSINVLILADHDDDLNHLFF